MVSIAAARLPLLDCRCMPIIGPLTSFIHRDVDPPASPDTTLPEGGEDCVVGSSILYQLWPLLDYRNTFRLLSPKVSSKVNTFRANQRCDENGAQALDDRVVA
jgi:hypothetical protein